MTEQKPRKKVKLYPILSDEEARRRAEEMTRDWKLPDPPIGTLVKKQAIYAGKFAFEYTSERTIAEAFNGVAARNKITVKKIFNIYAAPEDLPEAMTYVDTVKFLAELKNWHGFEGTPYATDKEFYAALKDGSYKGGWIIPPRELLIGITLPAESDALRGKIIQSDSLISHQSKGAFNGTFKTAVAGEGFNFKNCYWSSTEHSDYSTLVHNVCFENGSVAWFHRGHERLSCRPIRLVEIKP